MPRTAGSPGRARVCLVSDDIKLKARETLVIPATTVFEDMGPNEGKRDDSETWRHETKVGENHHAAFQTLAPVELRAKAKCAEVDAKMYFDPSSYTAKTGRAADAHLFRIKTVVEYPVPKQRPPVEIGKLIDDIDLYAVLLSDVDQSVSPPAPPPEEERSEICLAGARRLAAFVGAGVGGSSAFNVELGGVPAHSASYSCATYVSSDSPGLGVYWDGSAAPPPNTRAFIAKAGSYLTGATKPEILAETASCVAAALKPDNGGMANREFRGVKIECSAFSNNGGGGSVEIYRRFGAPPRQPEPGPEAKRRLQTASEAFSAQKAGDAARTRAFVEWYQDPSIPKDVKIFAMMMTRVTALETRCPTARSHAPMIAAWAADAGITPSDIGPGGRYFTLMARMMAAAKADVDKTSVEEACAAAAKYDRPH